MKTWFADESDIEEESNLVAMPQKIIEVIKKDELIKKIEALETEIDKDMSNIVNELNNIQGITEDKKLQNELGKIKGFLSENYRFTMFEKRIKKLKELIK